MFGAQQQTSSLFGGLNNNQPQNRSSLFGASSNQQPQGSSLFGAPGQSSGLFGAAPQPQQTGGLFGATQQPQQQQQQGGGLFGGLGASTNNQPQQQNTGLFSGLGASASNQQQGGLFAGFGSSTNAQPFGTSLLGASQQHLQQSRLGNLPTREFRTVVASVFQDSALTRTSTTGAEKTVPEQIQLLLEKWHPDSHNCAFQYYFYNTVGPENAPFFGPSPSEDAQKWEEALSKKPSEGSIPVLGKGFTAIGQRLSIQVQAVNALRTRLHEINTCLSELMQTHDLAVSVRAADARRKHVTLSQRCLALATKVQVLRNRGYAMDGAEEELKKRLVLLERGAFDPVLSGRQEEIWARMSGIRARARMLQEEGERLGNRVSGAEVEEILDETTMVMVKKVSIADYVRAQLHFLG